MKNSSALIRVTELTKLLHEKKDVIILDCTIDKVNQPIDKEHIEILPNAQFFDIEGPFSAHESGLPHTMVSPQVFTQHAQQLGVHKDSTLILYDRWGLYSSARVWWMFSYMGHKQVYVLNGGLPAWKQANQPVTRDYVRSNSMGDFIANPIRNWFIDRKELHAVLHKEHVAIVDARAAGRFDGKVPEPRAGVRSGHIPGSSNIPFDQIIDGYYLRDAEQLETIFSGHVSPAKQNIFTCGSGITASILALAAYELGLKNITLYDGSWAEWGSDSELPLENNIAPIA